MIIESLLDACELVLKELGDPQSSYWLASIIKEMKLWRASEPDVRDAIQKDIEKYHENSRFVCLANGEFTLQTRVICEKINIFDINQHLRSEDGKV